MKKHVKNHTCRHHSPRDGTFELKRHKFRFLEKTSDCTQDFCLPHNVNRSTYAENMGWEKILPLKIYDKFQTSKINCDFILFFCINVMI